MSLLDARGMTYDTLGESRCAHVSFPHLQGKALRVRFAGWSAYDLGTHPLDPPLAGAE